MSQHMNRSQSGVSSSLLSTKDMFSGELTSNTNKTGVGVLFQIDSEGRVIVKTIVGGGAADRTRGTGSHEVRVGDFITRVDGRDVEREPMAVLKDLILGPQGTQVHPHYCVRSCTALEECYEATAIHAV